MMVHSLKQLFSVFDHSVSTDDLQKYGQDWSGVLTPNASLVVFPKSTKEVSQILKLCTEHKIAVVPSGGRTGLSGGAVAANGEVVLSLEKLSFIKNINTQSFTVEVGAGAITQAVHEFCETHGLTWPVDFASKGSSTVGGNISTNAGGVRVIRYGNTRYWVLGLTVVLMSGEVLQINGALEKNNSGYDLRHAFIGTEGTLGVVTEAVLKLTPVKNNLSKVVFFKLKDFEALIRLFQKTRLNNNITINAFECLTFECLQKVVQHSGRSPFSQIDDGKMYALLEMECTDEVAEAYFNQVLDSTELNSTEVINAVMAQNAKEKQELWAYRENVAEAVMHQSQVYQHDLSVPVKNLSNYLKEIQNFYATQYPDFSPYIFGHIGDGNLHVFIQKPQTLTIEEFKSKCQQSDHQLFSITQKWGGSVSAEHGIGLLKKHALGFVKENQEIEALKKLKKIFDPNNLLNPGKIF